MKIAAASLNQTPFDWTGNANRIVAVLDAARDYGADVLCLPAMCLSSASCEDMFNSVSLQKTILSFLGDLLPKTQNLVTTFGLPLVFEGKLHNAICVAENGNVREFCVPGSADILPAPREIELYGKRYPISGAVCCVNGIELFPAADAFCFGKYAKKRAELLNRSAENGRICVYSNSLGNESGQRIYDGAHLIVENGSVIAESPRFAFGEATLTFADFDQPATVFFDPDENAGLEPLSKEEEFALAASLGLHDYLRKSKSQGFVLSLSGGADSAACAVLVRLAHDLSEKTDALPLSCVYQRTENSSETTFNAAKNLAQSIGSEFLHFDVAPIVAQYTSMLENSIGRSLSWETDDAALQNIQARVRGPGIWMLANLRNSILLTSGNRSEIALGYTTMDGDTCGSLSPVSGVDKAFLRHWLRWAETEGLTLKFPDGSRKTLNFPALAEINSQEPTAELRPSESLQRDEDDLMPYPLLNRIEHFVVEEMLAPAETLQKILDEIEFQQYSIEQLRDWVSNFYKLWNKNQWKRHRYAPGFILDERNLSATEFCYPILSGN